MTYAKIGELAEQLRGVAFTKGEASNHPRDGYVPVLRAGNIQEGQLDFNGLMYIPAHRVSAKQYVRKNDIVIATSSGSLEVIGKAGRSTSNYSGCFGAFLKVMRPGPKVNPSYFAHFFRTLAYRQKISQLAAGVNINNLKSGHLDDLEIHLPSLDEQARIAAILDQVDAVREMRATGLKRLYELRGSIFCEMFGNPLKNPRGLPVGTLGSVAEIVTGNSPSRADAANFGQYMEWLKSDNLGGELASLAKEKLSYRGSLKARIAPAGSVLVTCIAGSSSSIGKASLVDREVAFNQQINAILPSRDLLDSTFILAQLKLAPALVQRKSTGGMKGLVSKSAFQAIEILVPRLEQQLEFGRRVASTLTVHDAAEREFARFQECVASLQARAFRGEL